MTGREAGWEGSCVLTFVEVTSSVPMEGSLCTATESFLAGGSSQTLPPFIEGVRLTRIPSQDLREGGSEGVFEGT